MNILFLTLINFNSIEERGIYHDLLRYMQDKGHTIYIACPNERRRKRPTELIIEQDCHILKIKTLNIQKTNIIEKGIGTLQLETKYLKAIKTHFNNVKFQLVLYSTPPITLTEVIQFIKERDNAFCYLLLKDIFPQNAVDLGMMKAKGLLYRFFRNKEGKLYGISDKIGCMSPANVAYILAHNHKLKPEKVEVNPNSIMPLSFELSQDAKIRGREEWQIPPDALTFIYGGNLGKPQGIPFS